MEWISVKDKLPEYTNRIGNQRFVILILADKHGGVWPGDYTEGEFYIFGAKHSGVTHFMYFPKHPNEGGKNEFI